MSDYKIDYSLYPKHNWNKPDIYDSGFFHLSCKECNYAIRVRYKNFNNNKSVITEKCYIAEYINFTMNKLKEIHLTTEENIDEVRKNLLSCDEVKIKLLLE